MPSRGIVLHSFNEQAQLRMVPMIWSVRSVGAALSFLAVFVAGAAPWLKVFLER
jgi:hypothetical protein